GPQRRNSMRGRVLIIAGSDSGGGAGIQADIKTVTMLDAYAACAITALTAQNTEGVFGVLPIPPDFIRRQIEVVLDDIGADAIKTGMLHDLPVIEMPPALPATAGCGSRSNACTARKLDRSRRLPALARRAAA